MNNCLVTRAPGMGCLRIRLNFNVKQKADYLTDIRRAVTSPHEKI